MNSARAITPSMEVIEGTSALVRVHPGAIYLRQGESFLVHELDLAAGHAILEPVRASYYTQPREINDVRIVRPVARKELGPAMVTLGEVRVAQQVIGYRRIQQFREETLSVEDLDLPTQTLSLSTSRRRCRFWRSFSSEDRR